MSDNLPAKIESDLSEKDMAKLKEFRAEGLPGIARLTEAQFNRMAELYMTGSTYWQISQVLNLPRPLVMYVSHTYGWYVARQEYLQELNEKIKGRVINSALSSQDFLLELIQFYEKKVLKKLRKSLATGDDEHSDEVNLKEVDKIFKAMEILQNLSGAKTSSKSPAVGLNLGDGVTIERNGDNKVTITPTANAGLSDILKKLADKRREDENKSKNPDIDVKQIKDEDKKK